MELTLLGTGTPSPNPWRRGPSNLIRHKDLHMIVDCGLGSVHRLVESGDNPEDIDTVFITHLHADHYTDLGYLILSRWFRGNDQPLNIYGPTGLKRIVGLWMQLNAYDIEKRRHARLTRPSYPETIVHEFNAGSVFEKGGLTVTAFEVIHFPIDEPYGFVFTSADQRIVITGDCGPCEAVVENSRNADILVHECTDFETLKYGVGDRLGRPEELRVLLKDGHTAPEELGRIASRAQVKKVVPTHLHPQTVPTDIYAKIRQSFSGDIVVGEDLMTFGSIAR